MSDDESITYTCTNCGWYNRWTYDEIAQKKAQVVYRSEEYEEYSLPCKNPMRPACPQHRVIRVTRRKK